MPASVGEENAGQTFAGLIVPAFVPPKAVVWVLVNARHYFTTKEFGCFLFAGTLAAGSVHAGMQGNGILFISYPV